MEAIMNFLTALVTTPMALVMALVAIGCAVASVTGSFRQRLLMIALAVISATTSWGMATNWRWPK